MCAVVQFHAYPVSMVTLGCLVRCPAAAERIKHKVADICSYQDRSLRNDEL
jgi:hypothetical protein